MLRPILALVLSIFLPALSATENSEPAPLAAKSLLLDVTRAGPRLVAVGDRGHVLLSEDEGRTWTQSVTPTRAMLTAVSFPDERHGWAVGHDGVIIATTDGGRTWLRQDNRQDLETIYLDVHFLDSRRGFIIGAYGKFMVTSDGGATWTPARATEEDVHLNRVADTGDGSLWLLGEVGTLLHSTDGGARWEKCDVPYEGSLFAAVAKAGGTLVVAGLRAHIVTTSDGGASWQALQGDPPVLLSTGALLPDGRLLLAGQGGNFFISDDAGRTFRHWKQADFGTSISEIIILPDALLSVGEAGAVRHPLPPPLP